MNPVQMIQSLFQNVNSQKASVVSLKSGQLLYGKVEKFLPNDSAIIRMGDMRFLATLKAELSAENSYLFEVRSSGKDGLELKVVEGMRQEAVLLSKNLPITKEQLQKASTWMNIQGDSTKEHRALEWMINRGLPFTKSTFQSLVAVQDSQSFYRQLEEFRSQLDSPSIATLKTVQQLKELTSSILTNHSLGDIDSADEVKQLLKQLVQALGLNYENEVVSQPNDKKASGVDQLQSLKQLLLTAMTELGSKGKSFEHLLNRLTGMQLISQDLSGPMQQIVMQLPLAFGEMKSDITLQWSGRKTSNGQIDPDYCRILFYLDLRSLNQTVVDMQVQNRVIHLSVMNDSKEFESIIKFHTPTLKENLESIGYTLSFINVNPSIVIRNQEQQQINPVNVFMESNQRVDKRI
ncbi:hypothetical protein [Bacillus marasmi]|uniref:hypothetical protein n=1 Tax=Bacillus marasmi TaxID=1926279 RepID=UPI0011C880C6|nr:hypothetical protein [Bacillus marasmi]